MAKKLKSGTGIKTRVSTGGQWLVAWQKANPGMFMPGVTMDAARAQGMSADYNPQTALWAAQDPSWMVAHLQQMGKTGGAAAGGGDAGDAGAAGAQYVPSSDLVAMRGLLGDRDKGVDIQREHDLDRLGYSLGVGRGADPTNRFSQGNLLNRAFGRELTGLQTQAAGAGQLFSGEHQQGVDDSQFNRDQGQYGIQQQSLDQSEQINRAANTAHSDNALQLQGAETSDRDRWLEGIRSLGATK